MKKFKAEGRTTDVRSDHLIAVFDYALYTLVTGRGLVLDYGDNENDLDEEEQAFYVECVLRQLKELVADGHQDLLIIATDDKQLTEYHQS